MIAGDGDCDTALNRSFDAREVAPQSPLEPIEGDAPIRRGVCSGSTSGPPCRWKPRLVNRSTRLVLNDRDRVQRAARLNHLAPCA